MERLKSIAEVLAVEKFKEVLRDTFTRGYMVGKVAASREEINKHFEKFFVDFMTYREGVKHEETTEDKETRIERLRELDGPTIS
jgi:hypothetical protein